MEFRPRLRWRAYSAPQNQLVGFKEPILPRGRGEEVGTEGKGRGRDGNARWGGKGKEKDTIREGEGGRRGAIGSGRDVLLRLLPPRSTDADYDPDMFFMTALSHFRSISSKKYRHDKALLTATNST